MKRLNTREKADDEADKLLSKTVWVILIKQHTHRGINYKPDDRIEITRDQQENLLKLGVINVTH